jgi:hypothetical protein
VRELPAADPKWAVPKAAETQKKSGPMEEILTSGESSSDEDWDLWCKSARPRRERKVDQGGSGNDSLGDDQGMVDTGNDVEVNVSEM